MPKMNWWHENDEDVGEGRGEDRRGREKREDYVVDNPKKKRGKKEAGNVVGNVKGNEFKEGATG